MTEAVFVPVSGNVGDLQQKQRKSVETKGSLLLTKTMISLDQILSLVPEFKKQILFNLAQDESRKLSNRVKFGHRQAVKKGHVLGSSNITGYKKENCKLVIE